MHVEVGFPDSTRIQTRTRGLVMETGLPPDRGGDPEAPGPFDILLCSLAACTGFHVLCFLEERGFSLAGAGVNIDAERGPDSHLLETISIEIRVPEGFPDKYKDAVIRSAGQCLIREQLGRPPEFRMSVVTSPAA
jgi:putative redox protein